VITLSKQFKNKVTIQFITSNKSLFGYLATHKNVNIIVKSILRMYGGIFDHITKVDLNKIGSKASVTEDILINTLQELERDEIITLNLAKTDAQVTFIEPREDDKTINRIASIIEQQNKLKQNQVTAMLNYVENDSICKSMQLLNYFGERNTKPCGMCSVCIQTDKSPQDINAVKKQVIKLLENGDQSSRVILKTIGCSEIALKTVLKLLLEHHIINITATNTYKLSHL
jgi:ATP-dependent DNA helicase RecQ